MSWRPGREATSHKVYIGTDSNAVAEGTVAAGTTTDHAYTPASLDFATTYFWKVDEVGDAGTYAGTVWSFTTEEYAVIDDFESYNDDDNRIYDTWVDGLTTQASGSQVGYDESPFAEKSIVHGGLQSMPLMYDNSASPYYSEAEMTFDTPQDLTAGGAENRVTVLPRRQPVLQADGLRQHPDERHRRETSGAPPIRSALPTRPSRATARWSPASTASTRATPGRRAA